MAEVEYVPRLLGRSSESFELAYDFRRDDEIIFNDQSCVERPTTRLFQDGEMAQETSPDAGAWETRSIFGPNSRKKLDRLVIEPNTGLLKLRKYSPPSIFTMWQIDNKSAIE